MLSPVGFGFGLLRQQLDIPTVLVPYFPGHLADAVVLVLIRHRGRLCVAPLQFVDEGLLRIGA